MRIHPILRLLYAPDTGAPAGGNTITIDVPEVPSAAAESTVEIVELESGGAADAVYGVHGPKEMGFGDPEEALEKIEAETEGRPMRERGPDGKFLPKEKKPDGKKPAVPAKPAAKVLAKPAPKPAPAAKAPEKPAAPVKVKLGDVEKTPEEWQAEIADLRAKAEVAAKAAAAGPEKKEEPPAPKPEEVAAQEQERFTKFVDSWADKYEIPQDELDTILSGIGNARPALARVLAGVQAHTTRSLCESFNKALKAVWDRIEPLNARHERLSDYERDRGVLDTNPEINDHPKGYETYQAIRKQFTEGEQRIKAAIAAGTATAVEKAWSVIHENTSAEDKLATIARLAKEELAKIPSEVAAAVPAKPEAQKPVSKSPAVMKPFNGDRPGGSSAHFNGETKDARELREMTEAGR
jgi:hypothetical protein